MAREREREREREILDLLGPPDGPTDGPHRIRTICPFMTSMPYKTRESYSHSKKIILIISIIILLSILFLNLA
jgi:hypothetical protein